MLPGFDHDVQRSWNLFFKRKRVALLHLLLSPLTPLFHGTPLFFLVPALSRHVMLETSNWHSDIADREPKLLQLLNAALLDQLSATDLANNTLLHYALKYTTHSSAVSDLLLYFGVAINGVGGGGSDAGCNMVWRGHKRCRWWW